MTRGRCTDRRKARTLAETGAEQSLRRGCQPPSRTAFRLSSPRSRPSYSTYFAGTSLSSSRRPSRRRPPSKQKGRPALSAATLVFPLILCRRDRFRTYDPDRINATMGVIGRDSAFPFPRESLRRRTGRPRRCAEVVCKWCAYEGALGGSPVLTAWALASAGRASAAPPD